MQFPDFFNPAMGIARKINEQLNAMCPQVFDVLIDMVQLNILKNGLAEDSPLLTQEDTLNGCDALGHMRQVHEIMGLPTCELSLNVFGCGCVFGVLGSDEFLGILCREHVGRFMDKPIDKLERSMTYEAVTILTQRWIDENAEHVRKFHGKWNHPETLIKPDGTPFDWTSVFDPDQSKHDKATEQLLKDVDINVFKGKKDTGEWEKL